MSLANIISLFRVAALPLIIFFVQKSSLRWAILTLLLALFSDFLDGYLARKRKEITRIGSFLDPFADRILLYGLLLFFVWRRDISFLIIVLFFLRDFFLNAVRWLASTEEIHLPEEKKYTVLAMYAQYALLFSLLLQEVFPLFRLLLALFVVVALVSVYFSFFVYLAVYLRGLRSNLLRGKEIPSQDLVVLTNRRSRGYGDLYRRRLLKIFARRRKAEVLFLPDTENMFVGVEEKTSRFEHIIIAGGDGSFEGALNYSPLRNKSLGFFPLGAGNYYYSYFYRGKRFEYLRSRFRFREESLDILQLEWNSGKKQTTLLSLGLDAEIMRLAQRKRAGASDYLLAGVRGAFRRMPAYSFRLTIDGKIHELRKVLTLTLAKVPYFGLGLRALVGKTHPADGRVYGTAVVNTHHSFWNKAIRLWALIFANFNILKAPFFSFNGKEIEIRSDEAFPLQAGGEFLGFTKWVKVKVVRKQKVLVV